MSKTSSTSDRRGNQKMSGHGATVATPKRKHAKQGCSSSVTRLTSDFCTPARQAKKSVSYKDIDDDDEEENVEFEETPRRKLHPKVQAAVDHVIYGSLGSPDPFALTTKQQCRRFLELPPNHKGKNLTFIQQMDNKHFDESIDKLHKWAARQISTSDMLIAQEDAQKNKDTFSAPEKHSTMFTKNVPETPKSGAERKNHREPFGRSSYMVRTPVRSSTPLPRPDVTTLHNPPSIKTQPSLQERSKISVNNPNSHFVNEENLLKPKVSDRETLKKNEVTMTVMKNQPAQKLKEVSERSDSKKEESMGSLKEIRIPKSDQALISRSFAKKQQHPSASDNFVSNGLEKVGCSSKSKEEIQTTDSCSLSHNPSTARTESSEDSEYETILRNLLINVKVLDPGTVLQKFKKAEEIQAKIKKIRDNEESMEKYEKYLVEPVIILKNHHREHIDLWTKMFPDLGLQVRLEYENEQNKKKAACHQQSANKLKKMLTQHRRSQISPSRPTNSSPSTNQPQRKNTPRSAKKLVNYKEEEEDDDVESKRGCGKKRVFRDDDASFNPDNEE